MALIIRISSKREERVGETNSSAFQVLEDEYLANARTLVSSFKFQDSGVKRPDFDKMSDQEVAVWYNDNVIYPDKVRLNCYYYRHYSFVKDIQMILCTVLGRKMEYAGEVI